MPIAWLLLAGVGAYFIFSRSGSLFGTPTVYIPDSAVFGFDASFDVQSFLDLHRSGLAKQTFGGFLGFGSKTAAQIITDAARSGNVKPQYILAVLQREQGLITNPSPTQYQLDWATGYGVPDTGARDTRFQGFDKQVNGAASSANMARIASGAYANASKMVGTIVHTPNGDVIPATLVAAMMLIYTPHSNSLVLTHSIYSRTFPQLLQA